MARETMDSAQYSVVTPRRGPSRAVLASAAKLAELCAEVASRRSSAPPSPAQTVEDEETSDGEVPA